MREIVHADNSIWVEIAVFVLGGGAYGLMEILFRGHTHWTMLVTGGACALTLFYVREWLLAQPRAVSALAGAAVVERLFNIPGMGSLMVDSIEKRDYQVIQAITLLIAMLNVFINLIIDLIYGLAVPRIRLD